jgi:hypothetical protein
MGRERESNAYTHCKITVRNCLPLSAILAILFPPPVVENLCRDKMKERGGSIKEMTKTHLHH